MLLGRAGVINRAMLGVGLVSQPLPLSRNSFGALLGCVYIMLPYMVLILYAYFVSIDSRKMAAARTLGARPAQAFLRIFVPLSLPAALSASMLVFILSIGLFITPALL